MAYCCVFAFGNFDWINNCWLVLGKAELAFQIPPGVAVMFPLSLFTHYNHKIWLKQCKQQEGRDITEAAPFLKGDSD